MGPTGTWKRDFASGLIVLGPVLVTLYILWWLFAKLDALSLITIWSGDSSPWYASYVEVAVLIAILALLVLSIGYLMRTAFGDFVESLIDRAMNQLPGLRVVYNASKMAVETAVTGPEELQTPVKITTWHGLRMTAFKTGKVTDDGRDVLFLPTAPNITTGFVVEVAPEEYVETDESVEDALTRILSAGFGDTNGSGIPIDVTEESGAGDPVRADGNASDGR
jgi:uncharacterized membrane protein